MAVTINTFTINTKIESAKVNTNFTNLKVAVDALQSDKLLYSDSDAATITFDMDLAHIHTVTLGDNRTLQFSNTATGETYVIRLVQDGTGSRTVTWDIGTVKWPGGTAPTLTTTGNTIDVFAFLCTGSNAYDGYLVGSYLS